MTRKWPQNGRMRRTVSLMTLPMILRKAWMDRLFSWTYPVLKGEVAIVGAEEGGAQVTGLPEGALLLAKDPSWSRTPWRSWRIRTR